MFISATFKLNKKLSCLPESFKSLFPQVYLRLRVRDLEAVLRPAAIGDLGREGRLGRNSAGIGFSHRPLHRRPHSQVSLSATKLPVDLQQLLTQLTFSATQGNFSNYDSICLFENNVL